MAPTLAITKIDATSPTLAESMRSCQLRAGLSRAVGSSNYVLGNPKSWLGTTYHEVLENVAIETVGDENPNLVFERFWQAAIDRQYQAVHLHPLNSRFGQPLTWPGYYIVQASARLRALDIIESNRTRHKEDAVVRGDGSDALLEHHFVACGGKLVGRPDIIRNGEIIDYKSGDLYEHDQLTQTETIKATYIRQLRIYGYLVKAVLDYWPQRGVLLPMVGEGVAVALSPPDCEQAAVAAIELLDNYNQRVDNGTAPEDLATPSIQHCKWCSFKLICPAFWGSATPEWTGQLDGAAVEGTVIEEPRALYGGASKSIRLDIQSGSEVRQQVNIASLSQAIHTALLSITAGDRVRFVGLNARADGTLVHSQRTVLARVCDLPMIV